MSSSAFTCLECGSLTKLHDSLSGSGMWADKESQNSFVVLADSVSVKAASAKRDSNSSSSTPVSDALRVHAKLDAVIAAVAELEFGSVESGMDPVLVNSLPAPASIPDSHPDSSSVDPRRHVLCADCAAILAERLEKKVAEARRERDAYVHYLESLSLSDQDHGYVGDHAGDEYEEDSSQEELDAALAEYTTLQRESAAIKEELAAAEAELRELDLEEEAYWRDVNKLQMQEAAIENERDSLHFRLTVATRGLERLEKTNVYNDAFRIWHDGPFGTINGFRLGRLPNQPVEWNEINAALGLSLLLVDTLASKLGFVFKGYKLVPMGSFSRIEKIDGDKAAYELYGSNDFSVLLFWNRRFDSALQAFLNCIQQLGDFVHERDPKLKLPYPIHKDKIGDLSVRVQFNQDEQWTRALKFMLVNIRFLLVCCVSQGGSK